MPLPFRDPKNNSSDHGSVTLNTEDTGNGHTIEQKLNLQQTLEGQMITDGQERYLNRQSKMKTASSMNEPHILIAKALEKVSTELRLMISVETAKFNSGGTQGRPREWYEFLKHIDIDTLAYIGLNSCFDSVLQCGSQTGTVVSIGRRVELENFAFGLKKYDSKLNLRIQKQVTKDHSSQLYRIKAARIIARKAGYAPTKWTTKMSIIVGGPIMSAVMKASDLFNTFDANEGTSNTKIVVGLTHEARDNLFNMQVEASWAEPMYGPMVVPPQPWTSFNTGCYYDFALASSVPLVRGANREQRKAIQHQFETHGEPSYVKALNAIQATPLAINSGVLEALQWVNTSGAILKKLPPTSYTTYPKSPENTSESDPDVARELRRAQKEWYVKAREIDANVGNMATVLKTAVELQGFEQFYLPWNFDFRGRMYPISNFNYHRDDHVKALFTLANGTPVNDESRGWISVHLANCGDFDKISKKSFDDRIDWVADNEAQILATAADFKTTFEWWSKADKPFQFLAAVHEYARMVHEGDAFLSYLPPSMDGTNSGVQHYSGLLKSLDDGALVNLVPAEVCQDVYAKVAEESVHQLEAMEDNEMAQALLAFGVTRKEVKRNTMTYGYSSVERGFCGQIIEDLMAPLRRDVAYGLIKEHPFGDNSSQVKHAALLAKVNYKSVQRVVKSVAEGMQFLQTLSDAVSSEGKTLRWETPCGFPVVQQYQKWTKTKVRIYLWDRTIQRERFTQLTVRDADDTKIDTRKMRSAVAANVVHSLDSAHMVNTILMCMDFDVKDFFMIHDSFGTTCEDTWTMYHSVRHAFVDQYSSDCFFEKFRGKVAQRLSDPNKVLPPVPQKGELDIQGVLKSDYCFS